MRWRGRRRSTNVEDRRGARVPRGVRVGGAGGLGLLVLIVLAVLLGVDPSALLGSGASLDVTPDGRGVEAPRPPDTQDEQAQFVQVVLADTEDVWNTIFRGSGFDYAEPRLVLFSDAVRSACGFAQAATGPFYCPADRQIYIDLSFYDALQRRFRAPGDFAQAYVIAHEVGHHVQNLLGAMDEVNAARARMPPAEANSLSVRLELQADCYAGVYARHADRMHDILEPGDVEEALRAASAIGDDNIQRSTQGYVVPESFTHGSAEQRVRWFRRGIETGDPSRCDTFRAGSI